jgi:hypothetical protein
MHKSTGRTTLLVCGMHNPELEILFYGKNSAIRSHTSNSIAITNKKRTQIIYLLPSTLKMLLLPKFSFRLKNNQVAFTYTA